MTEVIIGEIFGAMIGSYLLCKAMEFVVLKNLIARHWLMVISSAATLLAVVILFRFIAETAGIDIKTGLGGPTQVIGIALLPIPRIVWRILRSHKKQSVRGE